MLKMFAMLLLFFLCVGFGLTSVQSRKQHLTELEKLQFTFSEIERSVRFCHVPFSEILLSVNEEMNGVLFSTMQQSGLTDAYGCFRQAREQLFPLKILRDTEWRALELFFVGFGKGDAEREGGLCRRVAEQFRDFHRAASERYQKCAKLYPTVGVLAGLFFIIVLF